MSDRTESDYYAFMKFDPDNARKVLSYYTQFFTQGTVLELACGPGVFLTLLREQGVEARGVDIDDGMVRAARNAGHEVTPSDAVAYLRTLPDTSMQGLFAAHFLEHLPASAVQDLYTEAARVLRPSGVFVAVVPNAACLSVLGYDFWRDPTHVRFYDPVALQFFAEQAGLAVTASGENPRNHPGPPPDLLVGTPASVDSLSANLAELVQHAESAAEVDGVEQDEPDRSGLRRWSVDAAIESGRLAAARAAVEQRQIVSSQQSRLWAEFGHLVTILDESVQSLQHELSTVHTAYRRLLGHLYPANEVFVVAQRVADSGPPRQTPDRPPIEGTV